MPLRLPAALVILAACLVAVSCGGGGGDDTTTEAAAPPPPAAEEETQKETTTATDHGALPETPLVATLDQGYKAVGGQQQSFEESELPVPPGTVLAHWYRSGDRYLAVYVGVPADRGALCPGNSIQVGSSFEKISNAPAAPDACAGALQIASQEVQTCGDLLVYVSEIPVEKQGTLYASIERYEGDTITGVTGSAATDAGEVPEVDLTDLGC